MAVVIFLSGFLLGLLALALAEGAALLWAVRALRRGRPRPPSPPPEAAAAELSGDRPVPTEKQGFLWMLEPEKMPKVSINNHIPSGAKKDVKEKKNIVEVFPIRMLAKIKDHLLVLSGPDGSQTSIQLLDCTVVAVSSSNLPSRKWAKRYPIKLESKGSEICKGSNVCYLYAETSWEKESWSKALRLASSTDEQKLNLHARLSEQFRSYVSSLNAGYPRFLESSALSTDYRQVMDKAVKSDGSTKLRLLLKKFSRKVSTKAPQVTRTSTIPAQAERKTFGKTHSYHGTSLIDLPGERSSSSSSSQDIKQPSTPGSDFSYRSRFSDSPDANKDEKYSDDGTLCWNLLISRLFFDAKMSDEISKAIKARIQRSLSNMRTASYIGEITLTDLNLGELPPYLRRMRVLPRDLNELWAFEVDFEYCGGIMLHTEARLEIQEPELQKDIMKTTLEADSNGAVNSEFLENIEHYGNQVESSQLLASVVEDEDEAGVLKRSKSTGWKRWKNIVHSITDHVSQVPFLLAIKITSVRGTMRIQIKPPPCDRIWYGFTSMPELEWELESSIGERKITNSHIAAFISKRIKASLHQSLVLPNCESIPVSWMISEKDRRLSLSLAKCLLYAKCLRSVTQGNAISSSTRQEVEIAQKHWESALEGLAEIILENQEKQCWQVASTMLDYMIKLPNVLAWGTVLSATCSAIEHLCSHAPRISWRLQTEKWLSLLVSDGIEDLKNSETSLINLFCTMLSHAEPEQRSIALQQLGRIINLASTAEVTLQYPSFDQHMLASGSTVTSHLVTHTWNRITALALYDSSMILRKHAMALLTEYVPFVDRDHLRSFLASSNSILNGVGQLSYVIEEGYLTRMSLLFLSKACVYSSSEDIALIPDCVWRKLENMQASVTGGFSDVEKDLCQALCQLRNESDAKMVLKELLVGSTTKPVNTDYKGIRETILQVLSSLSSVESYFEFFSISSDQEYQELEEAEIELELIEKEKSVPKFVGYPQDIVVPDVSSYYKDGSEVNKRLQQIRADIQSLERSRLREEIIARRQKKLLIRRTREKYLEETSSREMELMQALDRERTIEMERDIERQRQLDLERAKSRELQYNLEMEREKQTQRELQRELEQVELGRSSRREFSANPNSRTRERYRERDNVRSPQHDGSRSQGHEGQPTVVVGASRPSFPTILQSRDRGSDGYEDNAEGSRDSGGDTSSMGDPEFDGPGSGMRHGTRSGSSRSSRPVVERRERDGRREGKWERKQ